MQELINITNKMHDKKVLVIGDIVADVYVDGRISRISREAPVLILEKAGEKVVAGGAAKCHCKRGDFRGGSLRARRHWRRQPRGKLAENF